MSTFGLVIILLASVIVAGTMMAAHVVLRRRAAEPRQPPGPMVDPALRGQVAAHAHAGLPDEWRPRALEHAHPSTVPVELALQNRAFDTALATAETAAFADPADPRGHVLLGWVLCHMGQPFAAEEAIARARAGGASGPLVDYVDARAGFLMFEHRAGETAAVPALITAADLAVVTLAGAQRGGAWLAGTENIEVPPEQIAHATAEHRRATERALTLLVRALTAAPGFVDARYWLGRIAIKAGMVPEGRRLLEAVGPAMASDGDAESYQRDLACLKDPTAAMAAAVAPPPEPEPEPPPTPATAKRSKGLRVLS